MRAKVPFFARTQLFVSGGALVVARLSLAEGTSTSDPWILHHGGLEV